MGRWFRSRDSSWLLTLSPKSDRSADEKGAGAPSAPRLWAGFPSVHVFPELPAKEVREHQQNEQNEHHHVAHLLPRELIRLGHPGHGVDQIANQDVVVDLERRSRRFPP